MSLPLDLELLGGECAFLTTNSATECPMRRRCRDCLVKPGCMIDSTGACVLNATTSGAKNYRRAFALNLTLPAARANNSLALGAIQEWEFPAFEATYCPSDDATCAKCIENEFWFSTSDSRFCVGNGGCICIHECELFPLQGPPCLNVPTVVTPTPTPSTTPTPTPKPTKSDYLEPDSKEWWDHVERQIYIGMCVVALLALLCACCCCRQCSKRQARRPAQQPQQLNMIVVPVDNDSVRSQNNQTKDKDDYRAM